MRLSIRASSLLRQYLGGSVLLLFAYPMGVFSQSMQHYQPIITLKGCLRCLPRLTLKNVKYVQFLRNQTMELKWFNVKHVKSDTMILVVVSVMMIMTGNTFHAVISISIYLYTYIHTYIHIYIYIYITVLI